jgi:prefoldin subunit 5
MLQAWLKLIAALWQALKNRFCDQLLIDCPSCSEKDVIYLGCLDLDANVRVRSICEVEHRKYVHTFRTVEYWLSIIPIQQLIKLAVEKFCCFDIPEWFKKIKLPNENDPNRFNCGQTPDLSVIFDTLRNFQQGTTNTIVERGKLFRDYVFNRQVPAKPIRPKTDPRELIALPVDTAVGRLKDDGIEVNRVVEYQPDAARTSYATALTYFAPDRPVTIIQREGRVAYFTSQLDTSDVRDIRKDVESLARDTKDIREAAANAGTIREDVDAVKKQATELSSRVEQVAGATTDLPLLRQDLESARKQIVERDAAIQTLNSQLAELQDAHKTASARIAELTTGLESASKAVQQFDGLKSRLDKVEKLVRPPG